MNKESAPVQHPSRYLLGQRSGKSGTNAVYVLQDQVLLRTAEQLNGRRNLIYRARPKHVVSWRRPTPFLRVHDVRPSR